MEPMTKEQHEFIKHENLQIGFDVLFTARTVEVVTGNQVTFDAGHDVTIESDGKIRLKAAGDLIFKGSKILEN